MSLHHPRRIIARAVLLLTLVLTPVLMAQGSTIVVYGASGNIGGNIVNEALDRNHDVIGVSRNPGSLSFDSARFTATAGDVTDLESMLGIIAGSDVVIVSVSGNGADDSPENAVTNQAALTFIQAAEQLGETAPRVIQVGGGSTLRKDGALGLDSVDVEEGSPRHGRLWGHWLALENYRSSAGVKWTVVTPPPGALEPGERTGKYRIGGNEILYNASGESMILVGDLAAAIIDEVEDPQSVGKRITVGPE